MDTNLQKQFLKYIRVCFTEESHTGYEKHEGKQMITNISFLGEQSL